MNEPLQQADADDEPLDDAQSEEQQAGSDISKSSSDESHDEWGDRRDYQVINGWSVIALILAVVSSLTLLLPIFLGISILAIIVSLFALSKIQKEPHLFMGRRLAILALVIAVSLGSWSLGRRMFFHAQMYVVAEENVTDWFQLLKEGKHEEAHQLSRIPGMRASGKTTLREYYLNEKEVRQDMQNYFAEPALKALVELGEEWSVRQVENRRLDITDDDELLVFQQFLIEYVEDGRPVTLAVEIISSRMLDKYTRASHWLILTVQLEEVDDPVGEGRAKTVIEELVE